MAVTAPMCARLAGTTHSLFTLVVFAWLPGRASSPWAAGQQQVWGFSLTGSRLTWARAGYGCVTV